jgi:hypothetical protein
MSYHSYVTAAIAAIKSEIEELDDAGTRPGCLLKSSTGNGYVQYHWCHAEKRTYVKKSLVSDYQAEIDRNRQVEFLTEKIKLLNQAL